jgi:chorismate mutase
MKFQRFVSLSAAISFVVIAVSSAVLYFFPDRRVTSWSGWTFLGLDKQQWDNLHINLGIFFIVMIIWHIYYNWKPIKNYLKVKKRWKIFTKEFNYALLWSLLFVIGTITMTPPFSILVNIGNGIKAKNFLNDANPPFGYAEYTTLRDFCIISNINLDSAISKLKAKNIKFSDKESLKVISQNNSLSPKEIYNIIKDKDTKYILPSELPIGIAHKSLSELKREYGIDLNRFLKHLEYYNIKANINDTFKRVAKENSLHPAQLYNMLMASQKDR